MQSPGSQKVIKRFFKALYSLKRHGYIRGKQTFTRAYGIDRWGMNNVEKNPVSDAFQTEWLTYLVRDYGVSGDWLLTGKGKMFRE